MIYEEVEKEIDTNFHIKENVTLERMGNNNALSQH